MKGGILQTLSIKNTKENDTRNWKHANFIVNEGDATSAEIEDLIKHVQNVVKAKFDVDLETEVKIIGEKNRAIDRE